jgi:hypothetical protein
VRQSDADAILTPPELAALLGRSTAAAWHGGVALGEVDERLRGPRGWSSIG